MKKIQPLKATLAAGVVFTLASLTACGGSSTTHPAKSPDTAATTTDTRPTQSFAAQGVYVKYTANGVPHIVADDFKGAGFASGYVQAKANACILADQFIKVRSERSLYYGPGPSVNPPLSPMVAGVNVVSDFSIKALGIYERAVERFPALSQDSKALLTGFAAGYDKFLADNNYLENPQNGHYGKCAGGDWVKAISPQDVFAYYTLLAEYASGMQFATGATFFAAPGGGADKNGSLQLALPHFAAQSAKIAPKIPKNQMVARVNPANFPDVDMTHLAMGSNGWGLSKGMTESNYGGGLLANPHFPYTGARRLFQLQIDVPSKGYSLNGAALLGVAIPLIGYNKNTAWTHTVSTAHHFTIYQLQLDPTDPMKYIKDDGKNGADKTHDIIPKTFSIKINTGSPTPLTLEKTFYYAKWSDNDYGAREPMLNMHLVNAAFPKWGVAQPADISHSILPASNTAFAYRDANVDVADQMMDQWLAMGEATDLSEFKAAYQGHALGDGTTVCSSVLWVNTMYADKDGNAFYIDGTSTPNLAPAALGTYMTGITKAAAAKATGIGAALQQGNVTVAQLWSAAMLQGGVTLLDGSKQANDWVEDPTNTAGCSNGIMPYAGMPQHTTTTTFVQNSNNSFWLTSPVDWSPANNTNGISPLYGYVMDTQQGVTPRTRMGLRMLMSVVMDPTGLGNPGGSKVNPAGTVAGFNAQDIINNLYSNRALYAEDMITDLLTRCGTLGAQKVSYSGGSRKVAQGCAALQTWAAPLLSPAAPGDGVVFNNHSVGPAVFRVFIGHYLADNSQPFATAFNQNHPVTTPKGLPTANADITKDSALQALAEGLDDLDKAGIAYNTKLGDVQCEQQSKSVPPGAAPQPAGTCIPWPGTQNLEGGFNIVEPYIANVDQDTRYPRVSPQKSDIPQDNEILPDTGQLSDGSITGMTGWKIGRGTSWHFGMVFKNNGPVAYGLVSYSQSDDSASANFSDQDQLYSDQTLRQLQLLDDTTIKGGKQLDATVDIPVNNPSN